MSSDYGIRGQSALRCAKTIKDQVILKDLQPMFAEAYEKGLWFYSTYQDMWFSPDELDEAQAEGRFIWGPSNWQLRHPNEKIQELEAIKVNIDKEIGDIRRRMTEQRCL